MMESSVDQNRLIQIFLSPTASPGPAIFEVSTVDGSLRCTCQGFQGRTSCKHTRFVNARIKSNNGTYPLEISVEATEADTLKAQESSEEFRKFVIKFGKVEVF